MGGGSVSKSRSTPARARPNVAPSSAACTSAARSAAAFPPERRAASTKNPNTNATTARKAAVKRSPAVVIAPSRAPVGAEPLEHALHLGVVEQHRRADL